MTTTCRQQLVSICLSMLLVCLASCISLPTLQKSSTKPCKDGSFVLKCFFQRPLTILVAIVREGNHVLQLARLRRACTLTTRHSVESTTKCTTSTGARFTRFPLVCRCPGHYYWNLVERSYSLKAAERRGDDDASEFSPAELTCSLGDAFHRGVP